MQAKVKVRTARRTELRTLQSIECDADQRYRCTGLSRICAIPPLPVPLLERGRRRGWLQAAVDAKGRPQGFALMTELQGNAWLLQLSVRRPVGRRGIGAALLSSICETAGRSGYGAIFLSTARGVPWTEPFYARRGFVPVPLGRYPRWMRHERLTEIQHGHVPYRRVIMQRVLRADAPSAD